jgi:SAM-dependent methyltransferase
MMKNKTMSPYSMALNDYFSGKKDAIIKVLRDDGFIADMPASHFFRDEEEFSTIEKIAVELCQGRVLDVGAGSGTHSLYLQKKGLDVWTMEIDPALVDIAKQRGIMNTICSDIFNYKGDDYGTILLMGHGIGITGTIEGFRKFLKQAYDMTHRKGIVLFDSLDVRVTEDPGNLSYHEYNKKNNRYIGEIRMQFEYNGLKGEMFSWLHLIPETLFMESGAAGWICEIVHREPSGDYLARLSKNNDH